MMVPLHRRAFLFCLVFAIFYLSAASALTDQEEMDCYESSLTVMGTIGRVQLWGLPEKRAEAIAQKIFQTWQRVDKTMSLYAPASDLARLNRVAGGDALAVSAELIDVLRRAEAYRVKTNGAFDVRVGALSEIWGLGVIERKRLPHEEEVGAAVSLIHEGNIELYPELGRARISDPHVLVDLGGIAKGYALDKSAEILVTEGVPRAVMDLGGQLLIFRPPKEGWQIGIREPGNPDQLVGTLTLRNTCSIATSSQLERFIERGKKRVGHIFDPRTGKSATKTGAISVVASSATEADALSTAFLVLSDQEIHSLLKHFPGIDVLRLQPSTQGQWQSWTTPKISKDFAYRRQAAS